MTWFRWEVLLWKRKRKKNRKKKGKGKGKKIKEKEEKKGIQLSHKQIKSFTKHEEWKGLDPTKNWFLVEWLVPFKEIKHLLRGMSQIGHMYLHYMCVRKYTYIHTNMYINVHKCTCLYSLQFPWPMPVDFRRALLNSFVVFGNMHKANRSLSCHSKHKRLSDVCLTRLWHIIIWYHSL